MVLDKGSKLEVPGPGTEDSTGERLLWQHKSANIELWRIAIMLTSNLSGKLLQDSCRRLQKMIGVMHVVFHPSQTTQTEKRLFADN